MMLCDQCGSSPVEPVVVLDIDGTLANYHETFATFAREYFNLWVNFEREPWDGTGNFEDYIGITQTQYREAKLAFRQGGNKRWLPIYPGAQELALDIRRHNARLWIATTRPWQRLDNIDPDTREWMRRNGIKFDGMLYGDNKYEQIVEAVDRERIVAVVEDLPEQCDAANALGLPVIQRYNYHNEHDRNYDGSWSLDVICQIIVEDRLHMWGADESA